MSRVRLLVAGALVLALAGLPAAAKAAMIPFGSNLAHGADRSYQHGEDTTLWPATLGPFSALGAGASSPGSAPTVPTVPADGQVLEVTVRGRVGDPPPGQRDYGPQPIYFQDLRQLGEGKVKVIATSQGFLLPSHEGIYSYQPLNLCVRRGDLVGLSEVGGFNATSAPHGIPFQVLASVAQSSTRVFSKNKGTANGAVLTPTTLSNTELLMQVDEGTGVDASRLCPGGKQGTSTRLGSSVGQVSGSSASVLVDCHSSFPCVGNIVLQGVGASGARARTAASAGGPRVAAAAVLGKARFSIGAFKSKSVRVRLRRSARRLLRRHHRRLRVRARLTVTSGAQQTTLIAPLTLRG